MSKKIDMRDWLNKNTVSALDLITDNGSGYKTLDVTISRISEPEMVQCGPKKEMHPTAYFDRAKKKLILRPVHLRVLVGIFGPYHDGPVGHKIRLYVEKNVNTPQGKADCIRIDQVLPNGKKKRSLLPSMPPKASDQPPPDPDGELTADEEAERTLFAAKDGAE